jgi:hypothetical protein
MVQEPTSVAVDTLIASLLNPSGANAGAAHLVAKLDHLVHGLHVSGHLSELSVDQVKNIIWALHEAGHLRSGTPVAPEGVSPTYDQDGLVSIHNAGLHEQERLVIDFTKARNRPGWRPLLDLDCAIEWTADWSVRFSRWEDAARLCAEQIERFEAHARGTEI